MASAAAATEVPGFLEEAPPSKTTGSMPPIPGMTSASSQPLSQASQNPPLPDEPEPTSNPPLPDEAPPLPAEAPPQNDDGWEPRWDMNTNQFYFFNRFTGISQWENPRVQEQPTSSSQPVSSSAVVALAPGMDAPEPAKDTKFDRPRYNPAIHGSYDPNADYAKADAEEKAEQEREAEVQAAIAAGADPTAAYAATGRFNRFTGKWQRSDLNPENFNDENKSFRQQRAFFDVEAAANSHDGKSLKAERAGKKLSKQEVKAFKDKRKAKKEEKRRAWLRD